MPSPLVNIGLPVYNGEPFLRLALDSLLGQDFNDFELIISDNASTDRTARICLEYAQRDSRVRYFQNDANIGAAPNHKRVFHLARGKYFRWAAHDDICLPGMLRRCVEVLEAAPSTVALVFPRSEHIDAEGRLIGRPDCRLDSRHSRPHERLGHVLRHMSLMTALFGLFRPEILRQTRLEDSFGSSDYVLLAEIAMLGQIWEIPEVLFQRRLHPGTSTRINSSWDALTVWNDPRQIGRRHFLRSDNRLLLEYMRSACRLPLRPIDRLLCLATIPTVTAWQRFRNAGGRQKARLRRWVAEHALGTRRRPA